MEVIVKLQNKIAVVTGGNSGIGFAIAREFVDEGAKVLLVGRRAEAVQAAVEALGAAAVGLTGDVAELSTHDRVAELAAERFGAVDVYVANAGTIQIQPSLAVSTDDFDRQFLTNARGTFFGVQKIAPVMRDGGSVILTSSIATHKLLDGHAVYAGSKAAIEAFARAWAIEFKERRIRVNVLSPGPTDTPIIRKLGISAEALPSLEEGLARTIPLGRMAKSEELARAAVFLASDSSSFVTGTYLPVDGGLSLT